MTFMKMITVTPAVDISLSIEFYEKAGFLKIDADDAVVFADSNNYMVLDNSASTRPALKFFEIDLAKWKSKNPSSPFIIQSNEALRTIDPSGVHIILTTDKAPTWLKGSSDHKSIFGNFAGISIEAVAFKKTVLFYESIGYKITNGKVENNSYVVLEKEAAVSISIMAYGSCPHQFYNPSLTYFNSGQNAPIIQKVKENGLRIAEEITVFNKEGIVDNIIVRGPGDWGFFIFND